MTTKCRYCRHTLENDSNEQMLVCNKCHQYTANQDYVGRKLKGGNTEMTAKKSTKKNVERKEAVKADVKKEKVVKEKSEVGPSKTDVRVENAKKLYRVLEEEMKLDKNEMRKTLSRLYNMIAHNEI